MEWSGTEMQCNMMEWNSMEWNGMLRLVLGRAARAKAFFVYCVKSENHLDERLQHSRPGGVEWNAMKWHGMEMEWHGREWDVME